MDKKAVRNYLKYLKYLFQEEGDMLKNKAAFMVQTYTHMQLPWHLSSSAFLVNISVTQWFPERTSYHGERLNMLKEKMGMLLTKSERSQLLIAQYAIRHDW